MVVFEADGLGEELLNDALLIFIQQGFPLDQLLNDSINQAVSRTVMTRVTPMIALGALYSLGGAVIADFSFAMIFGVLIGTYSSICLAVPMLLHLDLDRNPVDDDGGEKAVADAS